MCDKGGECPLQNQAMSNGQGDTRFTDVKRTFAKPVAHLRQVLLDRERCISCARCTRFSEQIARRPVHRVLLERGPDQFIGTADGEPFNSYFSGNTGADLPGRRADRRRLPVPGPAVRPGLDAQRLRALRLGLPPAHRLPARAGHPPAG